MKKIKIGLLPRIIIAIILGIAIGTVFPAPLVRIFVTFKTIKTTMNQQFIAKWQKQRK